ncbi:heat shock factor protein 3 isoform X2 [Alligator mississippiensis]|uniref:Heat shock factor protein 3 isoform B n=1 Tax=Alligator mississippiensis TaxID=8496 RepID=A0A151NNR3_ALLMI|nr:heat shock factor protein 3 isoform X2 [Alligator mississippiensis]KYO38350.1 heat shock factor protein 3 isoform B [Alligator mississippiensis]
MMKETAAAAAAAAAVPGFLAKLWALVEDPGSDDVICWSQNGQNFCILDEQRFAKELLPKYFKHNNLSSFIRQLNMYGFRKVIALENGMIMAEKSSVIEFQHPYFKQGKAHLLENIKRKASSMKTEDLKVCLEDLHKVLSEVQEMREQQNSMDVRLANMKRENKALWKEVAVLRQKHSQQQKLLSKILQFILSLMRGNYIVGVKRKRSLTDASGASPSKYSCQYVRIPVENGETVAVSGHTSDSEDENGMGIIIRDVTNTLDSATEGLLAVMHTSGNDGETQAVQQSDSTVQEASPPVELDPVEPHYPVQVIDNGCKSCEIEKDVVELYAPQTNSPEDPASMIDSILNESSSATQNDSLLDREEIQDFLNCIDASLEELQAMLSGKKFNFDSESYSDTPNAELPDLDVNLMDASSSAENLEKLPDSTEELAATEGETSGNKDMQVIQYRGNPLLSFLEELPSIESSGKMEDPKDLLLTPLEEKPVISLSSSSEIASSVAAPVNQAEPPDILGMDDQPLLSEDANGEYKLFPLLLLSPVANFIEEASEIETT